MTVALARAFARVAHFQEAQHSLFCLLVLIHVLFAERLLGSETIVRPAEQPQVGRLVGATECKRPDMVDFEMLGLGTPFARFAHKRTPGTVPRKHAIANLGRYMTRVSLLRNP